MKHTQYFNFVKQRQDRTIIKEEWIMNTINNQIRTEIQSYGRLR